LQGDLLFYLGGGIAIAHNTPISLLYWAKIPSHQSMYHPAINPARP